MSSSTNINIKGLDKERLLRALWENMQPAAFFSSFAGMGALMPTYNAEEAKEAIAQGYIDYLFGRCIKMDLSGDTIDSRLYDRDTRTPAEAVVRAMRK